MPNKEWYTKINGKQQGPFSIKDLKLQAWITPDTLVRKEGDEEWTAIGKVKELKVIFEDEKSEADKPSEEDRENTGFPKDSELALDLNLEPTPPVFLLIWALIIGLLTLYFMNQFKSF